MAKKSFFEKLGLVEGVAASEYDMPDTTNELRVCSGVGDHYINGDFPEDEPVQVEVPEGRSSRRYCQEVRQGYSDVL